MRDKDAEMNLIPLAVSTVADASKLADLTANIKKMALPDSANKIALEVLKLVDE